MARSEYIYLLMTDSYESEVVGAFTVKREALAAKATLDYPASVVLYRLRDNGKMWEDLQRVEG